MALTGQWGEAGPAPPGQSRLADSPYQVKGRLFAEDAGRLFAAVIRFVSRL